MLSSVTIEINDLQIVEIPLLAFSHIRKEIHKKINVTKSNTKVCVEINQNVISLNYIRMH